MSILSWRILSITGAQNSNLDDYYTIMLSMSTELEMDRTVPNTATANSRKC